MVVKTSILTVSNWPGNSNSAVVGCDILERCKFERGRPEWEERRCALRYPIYRRYRRNLTGVNASARDDALSRVTNASARRREAADDHQLVEDKIHVLGNLLFTATLKTSLLNQCPDKEEYASAEIFLGPESFCQSKQQFMLMTTDQMLTVFTSNDLNGSGIRASKGSSPPIQMSSPSHCMRSHRCQSLQPPKISSPYSSSAGGPLVTEQQKRQ